MLNNYFVNFYQNIWNFNHLFVLNDYQVIINTFSYEPLITFENIYFNKYTYNILGVINSLFVYIFFLFVFSVFFKKNYFNWVFSFFSLNEKEVNSTDDFVFIIMIVISAYFFNFFGCFNFFSNLNSSNLMLVFTLMLVLILILIPTSMVFNFGFYFLISIRGGATTLSFLYELILDFINLTSFYLRICIQLLRLVIIGVTYYGYNHLIFTYNFFLFSFFYNDFFINSSDIILFIVRLIFEVGHTFIMFGAQFAAFCVMVLWLFQFLFTLFVKNNLELSNRIN